MPYFPVIQQDQYPATADTQCLQIIIPAGDEFKALLAGLIVSASDVNNYADPSSAAADGLAAVWDQAYSEIMWNACPVPEDVMLNIDLFCCNGSVNAGTPTYSANAVLPFGYSLFSDTTASRYISNPVWLKSGDYAYSGWYAKNTSSGNAQIKLYKAGVFIGNLITGIDQYAAVFGGRFSATTTFTVGTDDFYEIRSANDGTKNGSSSGFSVNWTSHHLRQTA